MKRIFTTSIALLFILSFSLNSFAQTQSYAEKKAQFWKEYQKYLQLTDHNIETEKPIDSNGLFVIDENNRFNMKTPLKWNNFTGPIISGQQRDAVSSYVFSQATTTYTPATGGTVACTYSTFCDDSYHGPYTIPFTFTYNGTAFTQFGLQDNGWMILGAASGSGYSPICTGSYANVLAPFARDLLGNNAADSLRYIVLGTSPNRILVAEWWHWGIYGTGGNEIDFQIQLYETSNVIKFVYKPETITSSVTDVQVGIMGTTNADFQTRTTTTSWSATTAGTACSYNTFNSTVYPANGLTFVWTPPVAATVPVVTTTTPVVTGSTTCTSGGNVSDTGQAQCTAKGVCWNTTGNPTISDAHTTDGSGLGVFTSYITGLTPGTLYHVRAYGTNSVGTGYGADLTFTTCSSITLPYTEGFETISGAGSWPCAFTQSYAGNPTTYTAPSTYNRRPHSGNNYAAFQYLSGTTKWVFTPAIPLTSGTTYIFSIWYAADGIAGWQNFSCAYGTSATPGAMTTIATVVPAVDTVYRQLSGTFTPATTGNYYIGLSELDNGVPWYFSFDDYRLAVASNMGYVSSTTIQLQPGVPIVPNTVNNQIIQVQVVDTGNLNPFSVTRFRFETAGSNNPANDIVNAKVYFTGASNVFSTSNLFGTAASPNGVFNVSGSAQMVANATNYFWVTYDVARIAVAGDSLDAQCDSIIGTNPMNGRVPTVVAPPGSRPIIAPMCGTYTVPGSFTSIAAAINAINQTPASCPVIINVAAGWSEVASNLVITAASTSSTPITFQKFGSGANPRIVAAPGTGNYDGIVKFYGASYITFDGIDVLDTVSNTTTTTQMEWGYALLRPDATHGDQYITIKNCNISLFKSNTLTYGIYSNYMNLIGTSTVPTSAAGTNSNNNFLSNNITNCYGGYYINSNSDGTLPFSLEDQNNTISTIGGRRSSITNFGGNAGTAYAIYMYYQNSPTINNTYINSTGGINSTGSLYGIYNYAYYSAGNSNIIGDTITLVDSTPSVGYQYAIYNYTYYGNTVNIQNNVVQNCYNPTASYYNYYIYNPTGSMSYLQNVNITGNKIINNIFGITGSTTTYTYNLYNGGSAAQTVNVSNNLDSANVVRGTSSYVYYLMYNPVSCLNYIMKNNRIVNDTLCGTTSANSIYGMYVSTGGYNSTVFDSNKVMNNVLPSTSSPYFYIMQNSSPATYVDFSYNTVSGNVSSGSGYYYSIYYSGSPYYGSTVNINNNNIQNQQKITATGAGGIYGIYQSGSGQGIVNINNNNITGWSSAAATACYGIYQGSSPVNNVNINNNTVGNFTIGGAGTIYGIYDYTSNSTANVNIAQDSVFNMSSAGGTIYGIYNYSGLNINISRNRISGLTSTVSTAPYVYGVYVGSGTNNYLYNNFISDLNTPASTLYSPPGLIGMYIAGGTNNYVYYNTIFLKSTSSGTTFGTACLYNAYSYNIDLRNNALVNLTTPGASGGYAVAFQRSSYYLSTYLPASNNNCFYAGNPSAYNLLYYDGTYPCQTIASMKTNLNPREGSSFREYPPFMNSSTTPYDLRINTSTGTQLESGAQVISTSGLPIAPINITNDAFGTPRYPNLGYPIGSFTPTNPDVGANEFGGINRDTVAPFIAYTALGTGGTSNRAFNNVIITSPVGINVTSGTKPRCYFKRSTDGNVINDNTNTTDGWKYVESNGTTSPFDFTINYSLLYGGTGVVAGQYVQYFVIAQDLATTPNVGVNQATFATYPTSVALTAPPNAGTMNQYLIGTGGTFAGTYLVGAGQTYTSLTGVSGIFAAINNGTVSGNITISITSNTVEDGTNGLNLTNETGPGGYWIRIVPSSASMYVLAGSSFNTYGMIRMNGAKRVVFDGQNGLGAGNYLTMTNLGGSYPTLGFVNDAIRDSVKYCNIQSNNINTGSGTVYFGYGAVWGNDSITLAYCNIKDTSGYNTPANAIYSIGSTTNYQIYNNWDKITNCNIYNWFYDAGAYTAGIYLSNGSSDWTISNNSFYQTATRTVINASTFVPIFINSTLENDIIITNNYIGGSAPNCGGGPTTYTGTGTYNFIGIYAYSGGIAPTSIQGNVIQNISLTTSPASSSSSYFFRGIWVGYAYSWVNIGNISGNTIGASSGNGSISLTMNTTTSSYTGIAGIYDNGFGAVMNNIIGSITIGGTSTGTSDYFYGIAFMNTSLYGNTFDIMNNLVGSTSTTNSIQMSNANSAHYIQGIYFYTYSGTIDSVTGNTVANITSGSTLATYQSFIYGIRYGSTYNTTTVISNNTVRNLTVNTNYIITSISLAGILNTSYGPNTEVGNAIYSLYSLGTTGATVTVGAQCRGMTGGFVSQNKVYDFKMLGAGTVATTELIGLNISDYGVFTVSNNMVCITNGDPSFENVVNRGNQDTYKPVTYQNVPVNLDAIPKDKRIVNLQAPANVPNVTLEPATVENNSGSVKQNVNKAIKENKIKNNNGTGPNSTVNASIAGIFFSGNTFSAPVNFFYNTVYIGGSQPGAATNSWDFLRTANGICNLKNNFFINARTGVGNYNYAVGNEGSLTEGWPASSLNYNAYIVSSDAAVGEWGIGNPLGLTQWVTTTGTDLVTWQSNTTNINVANLLVNIGTCDLRIVTSNSSAWIVAHKGIALAGQNIDFMGNARVTSISNGVTCIGAYEFAANPPSNPLATQVGTPGPGATTNYMLFGRTLCSIYWYAGGTSYPSSMNVYYWSGSTPPTANGLAPTYSTSYWTVTPVGTLSGTTYDLVFNFGDNETYTINSPNPNVILANTNGTFWEAFPSGAKSLQSALSWGGLNFMILGQNNTSFSTYALTDGSVVPALTYPLNRSVNMPVTDTLKWTAVNGASAYRVQLATDSLFNNVVLDDSTVTGTSRIVTGLGSQPYFWRVRAKLSGIVAPFAAAYKFAALNPVATLNLNVIPGGFYNSSNQLNMRDTLRILLGDSASQTLVDSIRVLLDSVSFTATPAPTFSRANTGNYYIFVFHRNHLPIASAHPVNIIRGSAVSYDFTSDSSKTFGMNVVKVSTSPVKWGMIPGDANADQYVDATDQLIWIQQNGSQGYGNYSADFNGDTYVDAIDQAIWIAMNGQSSYLPWAVTGPVTRVVKKIEVNNNNKNNPWNVIPQINTQKSQVKPNDNKK